MELKKLRNDGGVTVYTASIMKQRTELIKIYTSSLWVLNRLPPSSNVFFLFFTKSFIYHSCFLLDKVKEISLIQFNITYVSHYIY